MIVAITEAKPKNCNKDYELENYSLHPINLENNKGRGIAVYIHKSLEKSCADITAAVDFDECCLIEVRLRGGDLMLFACCYRSPTQSNTSRKRGNDEPSTLDLILTDEEMQVSEVKYLAPLGKSDHSTILFDPLLFGLYKAMDKIPVVIKPRKRRGRPKKKQ